jgi:hypothetical protein
VVDPIDLYRPIVLWTPVAGETAEVSGTASIPNAARSTLVGSAGQFAPSMAGYWITLAAEGGGWLAPSQIVSVSADGSTLTLRDAYGTGRAGVDYRVHERRENIRTIDEFVDAFNVAFAGSPVLGTIAFDAASGDLRIPLRLSQRLVGLDAPIDLALGEGQAITLSTSAVGKLGVDVEAGFDLVLALGGERFEIALEGLHAQAGLALAVSDLEVAAQMGFLGLKAGGLGTGTGVSLDADVRFALDRDPDAETVGDTRFTLSQLGSTEALQAVRFDIDGTASATLKGLSVVGGKGASFAIAPELELSVTVPDLTDLGSAVVVLPDVADVGALFDLSKLSFGDIVEGLRFALATVADVVG